MGRTGMSGGKGGRRWDEVYAKKATAEGGEGAEREVRFRLFP